MIINSASNAIYLLVLFSIGLHCEMICWSEEVNFGFSCIEHRAVTDRVTHILFWVLCYYVIVFAKILLLCKIPRSQFLLFCLWLLLAFLCTNKRFLFCEYSYCVRNWCRIVKLRHTSIRKKYNRLNPKYRAWNRLR